MVRIELPENLRTTGVEIEPLNDYQRMRGATRTKTSIRTPTGRLKPVSTEYMSTRFFDTITKDNAPLMKAINAFVNAKKGTLSSLKTQMGDSDFNGMMNVLWSWFSRTAM